MFNFLKYLLLCIKLSCESLFPSWAASGACQTGGGTVEQAALLECITNTFFQGRDLWLSLSGRAPEHGETGGSAAPPQPRRLGRRLRGGDGKVGARHRRHAHAELTAHRRHEG